MQPSALPPTATIPHHRKWDGKHGGKLVHRMELQELNTSSDRYFLPLKRCKMDCNHRGRCIMEKGRDKPMCL
jgi:hypothetical protein